MFPLAKRSFALAPDFKSDRTSDSLPLNAAQCNGVPLRRTSLLALSLDELKAGGEFAPSCFAESRSSAEYALAKQTWQKNAKIQGDGRTDIY